MSTVKEEAAELCKAFGKAGVLIVDPHAIELVELAREHCRLATVDCNQGLNKLQNENRKATESRIREICLLYKLRVGFDGDPRVYTVKLHAPKFDVHNNGFGGYGIGESE